MDIAGLCVARSIPTPARMTAARFLRRAPVLRAGEMFRINMTRIEQDLLEALAALDEAARSMPHANPKPDLLALFRRVDDCAALLPPSADPQLKHFLARKSYQKAREFLEGAAPS